LGLFPAEQRVFSFDRSPGQSLTMTQLQIGWGRGAIQSIRLPQAGALLLGAVIVALLAVVGYALQRELSRQPASDAATPMVSAVPARALSADEEGYAAALWPIHREAKLAALGLSFAGIAYKTDGQDPAKLEAEVEPLAQGFRAAIAKARALEVPASMRDVHERFLGVLAAYRTAADEMLQAARDGRDQRLIAAQGLSFRAAEDALRVGNVLWPGEYRPH
jgi:hypothetical protein